MSVTVLSVLSGENVNLFKVWESSVCLMPSGCFLLAVLNDFTGLDCSYLCVLSAYSCPIMLLADICHLLLDE